MPSAIQRLATLHELDSLAEREPDGPGGGPVAVAEPKLEDLVFRARKLVPETPAGSPHAERFATGIANVDRLLDGGVERGELVEVVGRRTSGRFSLVLSALAAATRRGEAAALVDLGDHLEPEAAQRAGVEVERLLWLRPQHSRAALGGAEMLLAAGFPLVVVDLGQPPVPGGRGVEASWLRLQRAAQTHRGALLVSSPYRASGTAAQAVLEIGRGRGGWLGPARAPRLLGGWIGRVSLSKARGRLHRHAAAEDRDAEFELRVPETVSKGPQSGPQEALETTVRRWISAHREAPGWSGWSPRETDRRKKVRHG